MFGATRHADPWPPVWHIWRQLGANVTGLGAASHMPSLIRFLVVVGIIGAAVIGGLYVMAVFFEPAQRETSTPLPGVKVRR